MWLSGGLRPDFHTIARFRHDKFNEFASLFVDSIRLCKEAGLVLLHVVSVDGTKIKADAGKKSLYDQKRLDREMEAVEKILREAEELDASEDDEHDDDNGRGIPDDLKDPVKRKAKLEEIAKKLKDSGSKMISTSDEDCRMMQTRNGLHPSFNVQAAVDSHSQVIVASKVVQSEHDHGQLPDMLYEVKKNVGLSPCLALADTGYCDESTLVSLAETGQAALLPPQKHSQESKRNDLFCSLCFLPDQQRDVLMCPAGRELSYRQDVKTGSGTYRVYRAKGCKSCSFRNECVRAKGQSNRQILVGVTSELRQSMVKRLSSDAGKEVYGLRKETVEPVFGQVKHNRHFDRFLLRGINGAGVETSLVFLAHNLFKCVRRSIDKRLLGLCRRQDDIQHSLLQLMAVIYSHDIRIGAEVA
jgi:hypothetical protein